MNRVFEKTKQLVMYFSYQERKKRELNRFRIDKKRYSILKKDELELEYINIKSAYEHKKNILLVFLASIMISVLTSAWKSFYNFVEDSMRYLTIGQEIAEVTFYVYIVLVLFFTIIIVGIIAAYLRKIKILYKRILMIEEIRKERERY